MNAGEGVGLRRVCCKSNEKEAHVLKVGAEGLDIDGLDLVVARPDDLAAAVHGRHRLLAPDLYQHRALIEPKRHAAPTNKAISACLSLISYCLLPAEQQQKHCHCAYSNACCRSYNRR